ncbi:hypothetical protein HGG73_10945 [Rhodobacteraceae bacterium R_SAG3]|nr:hypothetical protein [Rhodobacteraceae bacterium R_SAG3]
MGYEDGESFWNDFFETEGGEDAFDAIDTAIEALRAEQDLTPMEARREAHMRLEIAKAAKKAEAPVAVVCGAWHVPALKAKHTAKADHDLLKGFKKEKINPLGFRGRRRAYRVPRGMVPGFRLQNGMNTCGAPDRTKEPMPHGPYTSRA